MVRTLLAAALSPVRGLHQAAYLLALFALLSQLLGLVRDRLFAASFGAGETLDIYFAAFRLPDLLFAAVASLLSVYALLPILSRLEKEGRTVQFLQRILFLFFFGMGGVAAVAFVLAPYLVPFVAPGVASQELISLTRILLLQPILLGVSNIVASLTQLRHRFVLYSLSPLLYNLGIIFGLLFLYPQFGLAGLGWGVVLGAALHAAVQLPFFTRDTRATALSWRETFQKFWATLALSVPRTATLMAGQLSLIILVALASLREQGSIAVFTFAFNLQAVPLAIIGVSYSVAAFPTLARLFAAGERREFLQHIEGALRHMLFWTIPAIVLIVVLRAQLVRVILGSGAFDWSATRLVAAALALFVLALAAQSIALLLARAYYAAGGTLRPLLCAGTGVAVVALCAVGLTELFESSSFARNFLEALLRVEDIPGTGVLMLPLAYALGALVHAGLLLAFFARDFALPLRPLWRLAHQSFSAAVLGGAMCYATLAFAARFVDIDTVLGIVSQGVLGGIAGLATAALVLALLRNEELGEVWSALHGRLRGRPPVLESTDVS